MKLSISWLRNSLAGGPDDPHYDTPQQGTHAALTLNFDEPLNGWFNKIYFKCSASQYSAKLVDLLHEIVSTYNAKYNITEYTTMIQDQLVSNKTHYLCPVTYVPLHARGNASHKDCEQGVIISINDMGVRVLYNKSRTVQLTNANDLVFG